MAIIAATIGSRDLRGGDQVAVVGNIVVCRGAS